MCDGGARALLVAAFVVALGTAADGAERIHFESAARNSTAVQIFQGKTEYTDRIYGDLALPQGAGPFPAMVIMHSSHGVVASIWQWANLFNEMGVASFVVDSFTSRGLVEASASQLSFSAGVVDALRALDALQKDPRIDATSIGVVGFSRGAVAAMNSSFERYRAAVLAPNGVKFALHVVFYGGCGNYAKATGSPILTLIGTHDDFVSHELCRKHAEIMRQHGAPVELVVYDGALHNFDMDISRQVMPMVPNFKNCLMLQSQDTFDLMLIDGRAVRADEAASYRAGCVGRGSVRGGDLVHANAARERVRLFVAAHFKLSR